MISSYFVRLPWLNQLRNVIVNKPFYRLGSSISFNYELKVTRTQRSGTGAIRSKIPPPKPKREITKIENGQNTKRTYGYQVKEI